MFDRDVGRNYDQRSLYRKVTPNSRQISLHNRIFKVSFSPTVLVVSLSPSSLSDSPVFSLQSLSGPHHPDCPGRCDQEDELLKRPGL